MELGHPDAADDSFSLALDMTLRGNNPEGIRRAILLKAQNLEQAKRYKQAASHYGLFVEKFPKDPLVEWVRMRRGIALLETGQVEQASPLFSALAKSKDKQIAVVARALLGFADIALKNLQGIYSGHRRAYASSRAVRYPVYAAREGYGLELLPPRCDRFQLGEREHAWIHRKRRGLRAEASRDLGQA
jgi:tetratricopeptide (TPR) repeat protein